MRRALLVLTLVCLGCNTPRVQIRRTAERGEIAQALAMYSAHVRERGAPNPDALADVALAILERAAASNDARERTAGFAGLRSLGQRARDSLSTLARRPGVVGDRAAAMLFDVDGREGTPPARLAPAAHSGDPERIVAGLAYLDARRDIGSLLLDLESHSVEVRRAVAQHLSRWRGSAAALHALSEHALHDPEASVRMACIVALGSHGEAAADVIVEGLGDPETFVRLAAASALVQASLRRADTALMPLLDAPPTPLSLEAARALASRGVAVAAQYVLHALGDPHPDLRAQAAVAAGSLLEPLAVDLAPYIEDADPEVRIRIAGLLGRRDAYRERVIRSLRPLALQPDPMVAVRALTVLAEAGDPGAAVPLRGALGSTDAGVRRMAAVAWSQLAGNSGEVDPLAPLLQDPDLSTRLIAATEIVRIASH